MGLYFVDLDTETRQLMTGEIDTDITDNTLYLSNYLNTTGRERWPALLRQAARDGTDDTLAQMLRDEECFKLKVERRKPKGGTTLANVPVTAAQTLAESQFNMYYMRAIALRAISTSAPIIVYRAKNVDTPRIQSEILIGSQLDPQVVLLELRANKGVESTLGIPLPNSGLTVRLAK